jgi:beta-glucosidase
MSSTLKLPCLLDRESTLREWMADPRGSQALQPFLEALQTRFQEVLGGDEGMGHDPMAMILDMPLLSILMFQRAAFTTPVEDIVDDLLAKAHAIKA